MAVKNKDNANWVHFCSCLGQIVLNDGNKLHFAIAASNWYEKKGILQVKSGKKENDKPGPQHSEQYCLNRIYEIIINTDVKIKSVIIRFETEKPLCGGCLNRTKHFADWLQVENIKCEIYGWLAERNFKNTLIISNLT